jgi:hypothetical protein
VTFCRQAQLVNLTPHPIDVYDAADDLLLVSIPPADNPARAEVTRVWAAEVEVQGHVIPIYRAQAGAPSPLPDPAPATYLIVSRAYADALRTHGIERHDLLVPDNLVRDRRGQVLGCRSLALAR